jgi:UDP-N-acetylglucosamine transferase subunit ALG13
MGTAFETLSQGYLRWASVLILVLLGTNPYSFSRLARAADEYADVYKKEMFIQLGNTRDYLPRNSQYKHFSGKQQLLKKIEEAEIVITQGGFGSIADCLLAGKKVVAVPRQPELNESPDQQEELVRELEKIGRVVGVYQIADLPNAIETAMKRETKKGEPNRISQLVTNFIKENT